MINTPTVIFEYVDKKNIPKCPSKKSKSNKEPINNFEGSKWPSKIRNWALVSNEVAYKKEWVYHIFAVEDKI